MPCAYIQLGATGPADEKLTGGDPTLTFFNASYETYVNFVMEDVENCFTGVPDFGKTANLELNRIGDLVTNCTLEITLPELKDQTGTANFGVSWAPNIGHTIVEKVTFKVGGCDLDRQYGIWWDAWTELTLPATKRAGYNRMIGQQNLEYIAGLPNGTVDCNNPVGTTPGCTAVTLRVSGNQSPKNSGLVDGELVTDSTCCRLKHPKQKLYVPLRFWFNTNPGLALPLAALTFTQLYLQFDFRCFRQCVVMTCDENAPDTAVASSIAPPGATATAGTIKDLHLEDVKLWVNYIYLDDDAREALANQPQEQLIVQHQYNQGYPVTTPQPRIDLQFSHPVIELVWWFQEDAAVLQGECENSNVTGCGGTVWGGNQWNWYAVYDVDTGISCDKCIRGDNPVSELKLRFNGQDRFTERTGDYFNLVQNFYYHSNIPYFSPDMLDTRSRGLMTYSFSLDPEAYQPQGTANFTALYDVQLVAKLKNIGNGNPGQCHVFARNYNWVRIAGGVIGLAYQ